MAENRAMRSCQKTACRWPAAASLSYRYDTRQVWLLDLSDEADPSLYDLCPHHADELVVMRGWARVDQRTHAEPVAEPAGRDLLPDSGHPPVGAGGYGGNRYRELVEDLPRVAAQLADDEADEAEEAEGALMAVADEAAAAAIGPERPAEPRPAPIPVPSRDLAPVPAGEPARTPAAPPEGHEARPEVEVEASAGGAAGGAPATGAVEVPGQLAIPVTAEETEIGEAVVVSISEARRRTSASR